MKNIRLNARQQALVNEYYEYGKTVVVTNFHFADGKELSTGYSLEDAYQEAAVALCIAAAIFNADTYFDGSSNIHYYNGWKSNKAHKVNKRVVIPMYGVFDDWKYSSDVFHCYELENRMCDIEKVFNYLSDGTAVGASVKSVVYYANQQHKNRNLHFKYFDASIFKKGTCHLKFTDEAVVDALNIYVGKHKGWLPPSYGKVSYDEMNAEEQAVIDDFQGKEQYAKILANPSKYLFETSSMLALPSEKSEK